MLLCADIEPCVEVETYKEILATLDRQLAELEPNQRKGLTREVELRSVKQGGLLKAGAGLVPRLNKRKSGTAAGTSKGDFHGQALKRKRSESPGSKPCPVCRMSSGRQKRLWPTV
jgi:hypothetical protein